MSVYLTAIRLEISDKSDRIPDLCYQASHFSAEPLFSKKVLSYAEAASADHIPTSDQDRIRGNRKFSKVKIESYKTLVKELDPAMAVKYTGRPAQLRELAQREVAMSSRDEGKHGECDDKAAAVTTISAALKQKNTDDVTNEDGETSRSSSAKRPKSFSPCGESAINFFSGNPHVEITEGVLHLFKGDDVTPLTEDIPRSEMICLLAIPTTMTSQDLLQFVAPVEAWIEQMKVIRDAAPNQYMMLVKFRNQTYADDFYRNFNGKPFNSIEPEICHLVYVAKVESVKSGDGGGLPLSGMTELPVCPVCLERMDESVSGVLTILCNHSFHGSCLAQWEDTSCPVCRYCQTPESVPDNMCSECRTQESLWICLICGYVGCGRYVGGHAYSHYEATQHCYAMQLDANRVWDYAGDNYVHRLVQSKGDGKLVQVDEGGHLLDGDDKMDSINLEYTYLLTSQLETQRHYFEDKMELMEKQCFKNLEEVEITNKRALSKCQQLEKEINQAHKEKAAADKKCAQVQAKNTKLQAELREEKVINKCFQSNQSEWQVKLEKMEKKLEQKDKEIADLQEQLRDIMFYMDAQQKIAAATELSPAEIQESKIVMSPSGGASGGGGRKGRKKGR